MTPKQFLLGLLPATTRGSLEYHFGSHHHFYPWGGAMNGQAARLELARSVIRATAPQMIVETGTYRGTTTEFLCDFDLPVTTVEIHPRFFTFARLRLQRRATCQVLQSSSVPVLRGITATPAGRHAFYYLDSHWEKHLPLREELELILTEGSEAVVLIDDFKVADDDGYGFDDYGPGQALTMDYVRACSLPPFRAFYPSVPGREETGYRRGCVVLTASAVQAAKLGALPMLRAAPHSRGA